MKKLLAPRIKKLDVYWHEWSQFPIGLVDYGERGFHRPGASDREIDKLGRVERV
jgi:hypothetical protein